MLSLDNLWVLMITAFVDMIGFALILPLLPFYATRFGAGAFTVGLLMASFALAQMVSAPFWGRLSDRMGRRPVLLCSQMLAASAYVVFGLADTVALLLVCRFLQGAGGGTPSVVSAYVTDAVRPEERAKALGWISACTSAGVMIGPAIASFSVGWSYRAPGFLAAGLCCLNILFAWRWLPETSPAGRQRAAGKTISEPDPRRPLSGEISSVLREPARPVSSLILIYTAGMMAFMAMNGVLALFLAARFGVTEQSIGWYYLAVGLVSLIMRAAILGPLVQRFGEVRVLRCGALVLAVGMGSAPFAASAEQFLIAILLVPTGTALLFPSTTSLISRFADPETVGQTMGVQQAFGGVSRLLGPVWAGAAYQSLGDAVPFWLASALVFSTALFAFRLRPGEAPRPKQKVRTPG